MVQRARFEISENFLLFAKLLGNMVSVFIVVVRMLTRGVIVLAPVALKRPSISY